MSTNLSLIRDGKKFMWDGRVYAGVEEASRAEESYRHDQFEVVAVAGEEGQFLVYTRRLVSQGAVVQ